MPLRNSSITVIIVFAVFICHAADTPSAQLELSTLQSGTILVAEITGKNLSGVHAVSIDLAYDPLVIAFASGTIGAPVNNSNVSSILDTAASSLRIEIEIFDTIQTNDTLILVRLRFPLLEKETPEDGVSITGATALIGDGPGVDLETGVSEVGVVRNQANMLANYNSPRDYPVPVVVSANGRVISRAGAAPVRKTGCGMYFALKSQGEVRAITHILSK